MNTNITSLPSPINYLDSETQSRVRSILEAGIADNTRRAYAGDLRYFWAWARLALGLAEAYPAPLGAVVRFVTDHLAGLPKAVDTILVAEGTKARLGTHTMATISRRLTALSLAHEAKGVENIIQLPQVRSLMASARRGWARQGNAPQKKHAATQDILEAMLATCGNDLQGVRDRALLLFAFASGGRRRSEVSTAKVENLSAVPGGFLYRIPWSKTDQQGAGREVPVLGRAAVALEAWIEVAGVVAGNLFRAVHRSGCMATKLSEKAIARIVKKRAQLAGLDAQKFAAHSLRSGFVTEAGRKGVSRNDAMALTGHKSSAVFDGYYEAGAVATNEAARLAEE